MSEKERIFASKRYKLDHEPFDWKKEYQESMEMEESHTHKNTKTKNIVGELDEKETE